MNKLKSMITDETCQIREMYMNTYTQPNRFNFLFMTNHNNAILIDESDRRYCILKSPAAPHPDKDNYYKPLWDLRNEHPDALLHFLKEYPLTGFQPKAHAPMTAGKLDLIDQSRLPLDTFIKECVDSETYPMNSDLYRLADLIEPLSKLGHPNRNTKDLSNAFDRLHYKELGRVTAEDVGKVHLWAVRNFNTYEGLSGGALRQAWLAQRDGQKETSEADHNAILRTAPRNPVKAREPM